MIPRRADHVLRRRKAFERKRVTAAGFEYFALPSRPLPHGAREAVSFVVENLAGYLAAKRFLREENVSVVVGLGGYVSVPMARAASARGHALGAARTERRRRPGHALAGPPGVVDLHRLRRDRRRLRCRCPVRVTGNPIRSGSTAIRGRSTIRSEGSGETETRRVTSDAQSPSPVSRSLFRPSPIPPCQLLVLGGSGGARSLNENVPRALYKVRRQLADWYIVHQSGQADLEATQDALPQVRSAGHGRAVHRRHARDAATTDLAVCRAGGTTLAELSAAGVPSVLLPYPHAADDHQLANARALFGRRRLRYNRRARDFRPARRSAWPTCSVFCWPTRLAAADVGGDVRAARPTAAQDVAELIWSIVSSRSCERSGGGVSIGVASGAACDLRTASADACRQRHRASS